MKPMTYEEAFPGRFLSAGHFNGKKVTLTVEDVFIEELEGEKKKKSNKLIMTFVGKQLQLVVPKTNAYCIKEMFGNKLADWKQKRITFFPSTCRFGPGMVDCIRVWGSPDITEDKMLTVPQGRNTPLQMTMHATKAAPKTETVTVADPDQAVIEAWSALGWSREQGHESMSKYQGNDYIAHLGSLVDVMNAQEAAF